MIVSAACVLLLVLSGFAGLKDFGLTYTSSFDPELKIVPKTGNYLVISQDRLDMIKGIEGVLDASPVIEEKVALSNELNSGAVILKGVYDDYYMGAMLDSLSLIGAFSPNKPDAIYLGADLASSLEVVMSDDVSLLATAAKKNSMSLFSFSPFNTRTLDIEGVYQISSDIENKFAFTSLKTLSSLMGVAENSYSSVEVISDGSINKSDLEKEVNTLFASDFSVLDKQDLNPAVYLIFSLVALISMFNLVGSITIMMVEKRKDLRVLEILGGQKKDLNSIFFSLGVFTTVFGTGLGLGIAWLLIMIQNFYSFIYVPGTSIPYPVSLTASNVIIVFTTIVFMGVVTSAWTSSSNVKT
jgi:lipoprotein-releasing system permease protein